MSSASEMFDIAFIGHVCCDEVIPYQGVPRVAPGSAVLCGALTAARVGRKVTKMASKDETVLELMRQNGVDVHVIPAAQATYLKVVHTTADVDEGQIYQMANAGFFSLAEIPALAARWVHLAGITDQKCNLDFNPRTERRLSTVGGYAEFCAPGGSGNAPDFLRGRAPQKGNCPFHGHG